MTLKASLRLTGLLATAVLCSTSLSRADIVKANNTSALNTGTSWVGGNVPTASDLVIYNSAITGGNISALGGDVSVAGLVIQNPGTGSSLMRIDPTTGATLTIGASGIDMSSASASLQIGANIALASSQTWTIGPNYTLTQSGTMSGNAALSIGGSGTYNTSGNTNTYTGGTTLGDGLHVIINASGAATTQFGTGLLTINGNVQFSGATGNRYINNAIQLNGNMTLGTSAVATQNFVLNGGMTVASGTHTITVINNSTPTASIPGLNINPTAAIDGPGRLVIANGNAALNPELWVRWGSSGTFAMTADLTIGAGVQVFFNGANLLSNTTDLTIDAGGTMDLSNKSSAAESQTIQSLSGGGLISNFRSSGTATSSLTIDGGAGTGVSTFSGVIANYTGTASLGTISIIKTGSTTQIFSGSNSYTGQTQINAGTLLVNGSHTDSINTTASGYGSLTSGHFAVASGAVFGGTGTISGNNSQNNSNLVYVASGGLLAPGASAGAIGTLTLNGANLSGTGSRVLNMASGASFKFDLAGDGTTPDRVDFWNYVSGDFLLNSTQINLTLSGSLAAGTYTVSLFRFFSDNGLTGVNSGLLSGLTIGTVDPNISGTPTLNFNSGGNTIDLTYTVVPEPSTVLLSAAGLAFLLYRRRPRQS